MVSLGLEFPGSQVVGKMLVRSPRKEPEKVKQYELLGVRHVPPQVYPPKFPTLLGLIKLHIVLISSLNPGGVHFGGVVLLLLNLARPRSYGR